MKRQVRRLRRDIGPSLSDAGLSVDSLRAAVIEAGLAAKNAGSVTKAATTSPIVEAIRRNRPVITTSPRQEDS